MTQSSPVDAYQLLDECPASIFRVEESLHLSRKDKEQNSLFFLFKGSWIYGYYVSTQMINLIWGSQGSDYKSYLFLEHDAVWSGRHLPMYKRKILPQETYMSKKSWLLYSVSFFLRYRGSFTLKKDAVYSSKTLVNIYQTIFHHTPKDSILQNKQYLSHGTIFAIKSHLLVAKKNTQNARAKCNLNISIWKNHHLRPR